MLANEAPVGGQFQGEIQSEEMRRCDFFLMAVLITRPAL